MGMVGEACLPSNAYYPRTPDYSLYSGVHSVGLNILILSFVYGFMRLDYGLGTMTATTYNFNMEIHNIHIMIAYCMLNEWFFPGSNLEKNYISICSCNNSSDFYYISLHHKHFHNVSGTSSCVLKNLALFGVYRSLYSGKQVYFTSVYRDKQIRMQDTRI